MCDIAPFQMECENDEFKHDLMCCRASYLRQAWNNFLTAIPILGRFVSAYHCECFEMKGGVNNET